MQKIQVGPIEVSVDDYGVSTSFADYKAFDEIADSLFLREHEGRTGGSHGTEHTCVDYRINDEMIVVQVHPGALESG